MKKIIIGLLFISMTVGLFYACKKTDNAIGQTENLTEQSLKDMQLEKKIIAFRDKIDLIRDNPSLKSGTDPMEIDSAIWFIESSSNLTYGNASSTLENFVIDSAFIDIPLTNGQILWNDVQVAYDEVVDSLSAHNAAITANSKQLVVADISLKEISDNIATFEVISGFATDDEYPWDNDLDWYWGWELGSCDGTTGVDQTDAADIIAQQANLTIAVPGGNSYYNNVEYKDVFPDDYYDDDDNTLLFSDFQEYTLNHQCITASGITVYKNNLIYIGIQELPVGKSLIHYSLYDATMYPLCGGDAHDCWVMHHIARIKYGIWHTSSIPPDEL